MQDSRFFGGHAGHCTVDPKIGPKITQNYANGSTISSSCEGSTGYICDFCNSTSSSAVACRQSISYTQYVHTYVIRVVSLFSEVSPFAYVCRSHHAHNNRKMATKASRGRSVVSMAKRTSNHPHTCCSSGVFTNRSHQNLRLHSFVPKFAGGTSDTALQ